MEIVEGERERNGKSEIRGNERLRRSLSSVFKKNRNCVFNM